MKLKLSTQLSAGFVLIVLVAISMISLIANLLINKQFEQYVTTQQKNFSEEIVNFLSPQYDKDIPQWNVDYIHGFGMYALKDGYIIKVYDLEGNVVWDAENHDMTLCHQIMQEISTRMDENRPDLNGDFITNRYNLEQNGTVVGYIDVSYYSPYYLNEYDFQFLGALNQILIIVGVLSIIGAAIVGVILAQHLSAPIAKTIDVTREISEGNYAIRFESDIRIRELQELSTAVNHMAKSLETQESLRRQLVSDVAHEMRTPITNVSFQLEAIIEGALDPTPQRLQSCYDELQRISHIITDLEKLRQIESQNLTLVKEPVDLLELSRAVRTSFEPELDNKHLTCTVTGDSAVISGDRKRLHQVMINLMSNAIKYSGEGGHIQITVEAKPQMAVLTVEDHGIGISQKDLPLIFERFYRTDRSRNRKTGGAGIGLTIAKAIINAHNGKIEAESTEGHGSKFTITLPEK